MTPDCDIFSALPAPAKLPHWTIPAKALIPVRDPLIDILIHAFRHF
jgi:hypothetical protein